MKIAFDSFPLWFLPLITSALLIILMCNVLPYLLHVLLNFTLNPSEMFHVSSPGDFHSTTAPFVPDIATKRPFRRRGETGWEGTSSVSSHSKYYSLHLSSSLPLTLCSSLLLLLVHLAQESWHGTNPCHPESNPCPLSLSCFGSFSSLNLPSREISQFYSVTKSAVHSPLTILFQKSH